MGFKVWDILCKEQLAISYVIDTILVIVLGLSSLLLRHMAPFKRKIFLDDPTIQYSYTLHETVPGRYLWVVIQRWFLTYLSVFALVGPGFIIFVWLILNRF